MKRLFILFCILVILYNPTPTNAGSKEDYEEAYKIYIAAGASVAAYSDRIGKLATLYLEQDGWEVDHYVQIQGHTGARFLLAQKENSLRGNTYVLAIVGTENAEDVKIDFKVDKVYFADNSLEKPATNTAKNKIPDTEPKVHRGFNEFIQAGSLAKLLNASDSSLLLPDVLINDKNCKLYLTGHSLGGAAATLAGARLVSLGVRPEQIEIITFGAPAVGNAAFAAKFEPTLNLKRIVISGDPVTGVLQTLVGGYKQFGREIKWTMPATADNPHKLPIYLDLALKNYYDKRQLALQSGIGLPPSAAVRQVSKDRVYIAPLHNNLPPSLLPEFRYMREALRDEFNKTLPNCVINDEVNTANWREQAISAGCKWVIVPEVSAIRLKQEKNMYYITAHQTLYEAATGAVVNTASFSTGTYNLTPLEAFVHALKGSAINPLEVSPEL